jgi:L-threonylcarbamoyladenylate synthase
VSGASLAVPFWSPAEVDAAITGTIAHLQDRGILAYPTETLYGFGTAVDREAVDRLVELKQRPVSKPFLLLIAGSEMLDRLGLHLTRDASVLAARHWPGPVTLVLPGGERRVPERLRGPEGGIAVRWTSHPGLQLLLRAYGDAITSTSANRPRQPPAMSAFDIIEQWPDAVRQGRIRVLDGGRLTPSEPSTVVDCMGTRPRVIRPGAIPAAVLRASLPTLIGDH